MKRSRILPLLLLVALVLVAGMSEAAGRVSGSGRDQINRETAKNFSVLVKQTYCSLSSSKVVTPNDVTSTNTYTIAYCPTTIKPPIKVKIQYLGTAKAYKHIYDTNGAGVVAPTATCAYILDPLNSSGTPVVGDEYEEVFYGEPNISLSGGGSAATFTIEVYQLPEFPYQD